MESEQIEYFNWDDIQIEICKVMGINNDDFRDYHKVIGGEYKDLWHEWMKYFQSEFDNGSIVPNDLGEAKWSKIEWIKNDNKEWLIPFIDAVYEVWDKYNIENVKYSW